MQENMIMQLSPQTISILKSFSGIQSNILFTGGNTIETLSETKTIMASAKVEETFPDGQIGIFDLPEFLGVLSMFENPSLQFDDGYKYVDISEGSNSVRYYLSDPSMLTYPKKEITLPSVDMEFNLSKENLASVRKAASVLSAPDMVVAGSPGDNSVDITVTDIENPTSNTFNIDLPDGMVNKDPNSSFSLVFKVSNLNKLIGTEGYKVSVSKQMFSHFQSDSGTHQYWVALYKESSFG